MRYEQFTYATHLALVSGPQTLRVLEKYVSYAMPPRVGDDVLFDKYHVLRIDRVQHLVGCVAIVLVRALECKTREDVDKQLRWAAAVGFKEVKRHGSGYPELDEAATEAGAGVSGTLRDVATDVIRRERATTDPAIAPFEGPTRRLTGSDLLDQAVNAVLNGSDETRAVDASDLDLTRILSKDERRAVNQLMTILRGFERGLKIVPAREWPGNPHFFVIMPPDHVIPVEERRPQISRFTVDYVYQLDSDWGPAT